MTPSSSPSMFPIDTSSSEQQITGLHENSVSQPQTKKSWMEVLGSSNTPKQIETGSGAEDKEESKDMGAPIMYSPPFLADDNQKKEESDAPVQPKPATPETAVKPNKQHARKVPQHGAHQSGRPSENRNYNMGSGRNGVPESADNERKKSTGPFSGMAEVDVIAERARQLQISLNVTAAEFSPVGPASGSMPYYPNHMQRMYAQAHMVGGAMPLDMMYYPAGGAVPPGFYGYPYRMDGKPGAIMGIASPMAGREDGSLPTSPHAQSMEQMNPFAYGYMPYGYAANGGMFPGAYMPGVPAPEYYNHVMEMQQQMGPGFHPMAPPPFNQSQKRSRFDKHGPHKGGNGRYMDGPRAHHDGMHAMGDHDAVVGRGGRGNLDHGNAMAMNGGDHHGKGGGSRSDRSHTSRGGGGASEDMHETFNVDLGRVERGEDSRTTLMIKNIPNKYTQRNLLELIDQHHGGKYDFFYLPIDFKNKCNLGYAFINFKDAASIGPFFRDMADKGWEKFNSEKVCVVTYARIQGKAALVSHFRSSRLMLKHEKYRPLIFEANSSPDSALRRNSRGASSPGSGRGGVQKDIPDVGSAMDGPTVAPPVGGVEGPVNAEATVNT